MQKNIIISISLILLGACSGNPPKTANVISASSVSLTLQVDPRIKPQIDITQNDGEEEYGPNLPNLGKKNLKKNSPRMPAVGVVLGPGLNRVMAHIQFLKILHKNKIPINIISGIGMSSFVAALFANGTRADKIEWIFHKYFNKTKGLTPYSPSWISLGEKYLIQQTNWETLEELNLLTLLPSLNPENKLYHYTSKGEIKKILKENLTLFSQKNNYSKNFMIFDKKTFTNMGVDLLIGVDILGSNITFNSPNKTLIDQFTSLSKSLQENRSQLDLYIQLPVIDMPLDSLDKLSYYVLKSLEHSHEISIQIKKIIKTWQASQSLK